MAMTTATMPRPRPAFVRRVETMSTSIHARRRRHRGARRRPAWGSPHGSGELLAAQRARAGERDRELSRSGADLPGDGPPPAGDPGREGGSAGAAVGAQEREPEAD